MTSSIHRRDRSSPATCCEMMICPRTRVARLRSEAKTLRAATRRIHRVIQMAPGDTTVGSGPTSATSSARRPRGMRRRRKFRRLVVKYCVWPCKQKLCVCRVVPSLVHRIAGERPNGVQRRPPAQRDDFTAFRVDVAHCNNGAKVTGRAPIARYTGRADVLHVGGLLVPPDFGTPLAKNWH